MALDVFLRGYCCDEMKERVESVCEQHPNRFDCADALIHKTEKGKFGIIVHDGGSSFILIKYCPWCGRALG